MAVKKTRKRNAKESKGKKVLKTTGKALKKAGSAILGAGSKILGAGSKALNPHKRIKLRNRYVDLVIKGQAKKTPQGWKVGKKTFTQGRGTVAVSSGYYLDRSTGLVYSKRERNTAKRKRNADHKDSDHPIEVTKHWRSGPPGYLTPWQRAHHAGQQGLFEHGIKAAKKRNPKGEDRKTRLEKRAQIWAAPMSGGHTLYGVTIRNDFQVFAAGRRLFDTKEAAITFARKHATKIVDLTGKQNPTRKKRVKRNASRSVHPVRSSGKKSARPSSRKAAGLRKPVAKTRKAQAARNPSAEAIRKKFAGSVNGERELFFPKGTPAGKLAKLGKLVSITTEEGTIKPVSGSAWLCADERERLHIGSTSPNPLFNGPARSFGKVKKVEYESSKPHLGYAGPIIWFHHMGEKGGVKPTLHADGKGGLVFKGGNYTLTERGIEH